MKIISQSPITTRQIRPTRMRAVHPNKLKYCNIPTKYNILLNHVKQTPKENPFSQLIPLKTTRIKDNLFELQFILHEVINWKEILSMIDKQHAIVPRHGKTTRKKANHVNKNW
ncbi:unnamed protein product [Meloidogyne enterolobii]|uniref:Uncharacterized protein n=1 Tax=Meloidogyne enterolobii TaxID=390850 RepID=A0ACB0ZQW6_MELEN